PETEPWNQYELADGASIFSQTKVSTVRKTKYFGSDGDPVYVTSTQLRGFRLDKDGMYHPIQAPTT
ncbi:MAG: hypothetical protein ACRD6W_12085, partial [Nitrososphaerales archaeon]